MTGRCAGISHDRFFGLPSSLSQYFLGAAGHDSIRIAKEAKGVGYDVKTMRKVVSLRQMDAADRAEQETLLDVYKHALGMV